MNAQQKQNGFTIIEVVLVLAIAGLIFLMVFIALPALQRNQRDSARKNDASIVAAAYNNHTSNNRGQAPGAGDLDAALGKSGTGASARFSQLSENTTSITVTQIGRGGQAAGDKTVEDANIVVYRSAKCGTVRADGSVTVQGGTARQLAIITRLESGNNSGYCLEA